MPLLSDFYGISIYMYFDDHNPPHYHANYGEHEAWIVIAGGSIMKGGLPPRAERLVRAWHELHADDLEAAWQRAATRQPIGTIEPLP